MRFFRPSPGKTKSSVAAGLMASIASMLAVAAVFMTQSIFPEIGQHFNISLPQTRLAFSVASFSYAFSFFIFGPAADRINLQSMAATGLLFAGFGIWTASMLSGYKGFIICMALIGMAASSVPAAMFPYVSKIAPQGGGGLYMGTIVAASTVGVVLGRFIIGLMTTAWGWCFAFKIASGILVAMAVMLHSFLVSLPEKTHHGKTSLKTLYGNALRLFIEPVSISLLLAGFFLFFGFLGSITFLTFMLNGPPFFLTAEAIGWISLAGLTALVAPFSGVISRYAGIYPVIFSGFALCLAALQLMGWFRSVEMVTGGVFLLFTGVYCSQPLILLLIKMNVSANRLGGASAIYLLFCISGGSVASFALGPVWEHFAWSGVIMASTLSMALAIGLISINIRITSRNTGAHATVQRNR